VLAAEAKKAGSASEDTRLTPRPLLLFYFFILGIIVPKRNLKKLVKVKRLGMSKIPCGHKRTYCHVEEQR